MGYVEESLQPGEVVVHRAFIHWSILAVPGVLASGSLLSVLLTLMLGPRRHWKGQSSIDWEFAGPIIICCGFLFLIALLLLVDARIKYRSSDFVITNRRVILKTGWLRRKMGELFLSEIEGIQVDQSMMGRLLDFGTLTVAGTGGSKVQFKGIQAPMRLRDALQTSVSAGKANSSFGV